MAELRSSCMTRWMMVALRLRLEISRCRNLASRTSRAASLSASCSSIEERTCPKKVAMSCASSAVAWRVAREKSGRLMTLSKKPCPGLQLQFASTESQRQQKR
eukprot:scaffold102559_cov57-Phaeocystis_antarctica.AAC.4